jgi:hypothetical protein
VPTPTNYNPFNVDPLTLQADKGPRSIWLNLLCRLLQQIVELLAKLNSKQQHNPPFFFSVLDYGADSSGTIDSTTAIQNAINAMPAGNILLFPPGQYLISSTITITKQVYLLGCGSGYQTGFSLNLSSTFTTNSATLLMFDITSDQPVVFQNLVFTRNVTPTTGDAIHVRGGNPGVTENTFSQWINCVFGYQNIGISFIDAYFFIISACRFTSNTANSIGVSVNNTINADHGDSWIGNNTVFSGNALSGTIGISQVASGGLKVQGAKFLNHAQAILVNMRTSAQTSDLLVTGCSIEGFSSAGVYIQSTNTGTVFENICITGNEFGGLASSNCIVIQQVTGTLQYFSISGNLMFMTGASSLAANILGTTSDGVIAGNMITATSGSQPITIGASAARVHVIGNHIVGPTLRINCASATSVIVDNEGGTFANLPGAAAPGSRVYCTDAKGVTDAGYSTMMVAASGGTGAWLHRKGTTWYAL